MNRKHIITFILYCTCTLHAQMPPEEAVTFFYTQNDKSGRTGIVRGRVLSLGAREVADEELRQLAQSKTKVTVRLADKEGIIPGNTLYIINERNLIVSSFEVTTVFQSASFGYLLVGYGNFRRVQENFRVVQHREDNAARYAYVHKARGDYFSQNGDDAQAMLEYEKAIRKNRGHAESHVELGYIYLKDGVYEYALREFSEAYKTRGFIHDREDLFRLYLGMVQIRYHNAYESRAVSPEGIEENIRIGTQLASEAASQFPDDAVFHYYLGIFHFNRSNPDDISARDSMLKVIELDPHYTDAYVVLGRLYLRHDNREKALSYAESALSIEPSHQGAQDLYTRLSTGNNQYNTD